MENDLNIFYPEDKYVLNFINNFNEKYNNKLKQKFNFSRVVSLSDFHRLICHMKLNDFSKVAIISGSLAEPELDLINYNQLDILQYNEISNLYNLDEDWQLNISNKFKIEFNKKEEYDLVLCNQVLEHIYSPVQAFKNIYYILKKDGYAWISVPTINCIHGEPHFYSAGYHPRYLSRIAKKEGFEILHIGAWGNRKYLAYAVQGHWLTYHQCKRGFRIKLDFAHPYFAMQDGTRNNPRCNFITDTWALLKKN